MTKKEIYSLQITKYTRNAEGNRENRSSLEQLLTRFPTREPYPFHESQSIDNATVVDESVTETQIAEAETTYKETKTATENEMASVTEKVEKQANLTEDYKSLADETVGTISETMKEVTNEIKELLTKKAADVTLGDTLKVGAMGTVLGGVLSALDPQEEEEIVQKRNLGALKSKLTKAYQDLNYDPAEIPNLVANDNV